MPINTGTIVVTDGPGPAWRGRLRSMRLEETDNGAPVFSVALKDAWPVDRPRTDVLYPAVTVLAWAIAKAPGNPEGE